MRGSARTGMGVLAMLAAIGAAGAAGAQAPGQIPVQGYLTDAGGTPTVGDTAMRFAIFATESGGTALFSEIQTVPVEAGYFTAYVGDATMLDLALFRDNGSLWLEVSAGGAPLTPRFQLASVPYAGYAEHAGAVQWSDIAGVPPDIADGDMGGATYAAGAGLTLTGSTFAADTSTAQRRVTGTCPAGQSIRAIDSAGGVTCELDDTGGGGTTYFAGAGLMLSGTTFSVATNGVTSAMVADNALTEYDVFMEGMGVVTSTADETVFSRFLGDLGGVGTARVVMVHNGMTGRGGPQGGAGTATVRCGATTVATIPLEGAGFRPWTHITPSFSLASCGGTLDVLVRATAAGSPVVVREINVLWGH